MTMKAPCLLWRNSLILWFFIGGGLLFSFYLLFHQIFMPFVVALIIAYILKPVVEYLAAYKLSRTLSSMLLVGGFLISLLVAILFAVPFVKSELLFFAQKLPTYFTSLEEYMAPYLSTILHYIDQTTFAKIQSTLGDYFGNMLLWAIKIFAGLFTSTLAIANLISLIVITPLITFYVLRDWPQVEGFFTNLVPLSTRQTFDKIMSEIQQMLSAYFRGQATVCGVLSLYYIVSLLIVGLDFAFILGFISGLLAFIPYVGFLIACLAAIAVALAQFASLKGMMLIIGVYGLGHFLEAFFLTPYLVGDRIGLHPVWIIFSLLAGGLVAGFSGILLAVPIAAIVKILLRFLMELYQQSPAFLSRPSDITPLESHQVTQEPQQEGI